MRAWTSQSVDWALNFTAGEVVVNAHAHQGDYELLDVVDC
jgi:hypothetical protein